MRSISSAVGFLVLIFVITLLYKLPAKFIYQQLPINNDVQLTDISGSIWSGQVGSVNTPWLTFRELSWELSAWSLLVGDVDVHWRLNDPSITLQGEAYFSDKQLHLTKTAGNIDLVELSARLPEQEILLDGKIELDLIEIELDSTAFIEATGTITWKPAGLLSPANIELGEFEAELSSDLGRLVAELNDTGGATILRGDFNLSRQGAYDYSTVIGVRDTSVPGLLDNFNQLGSHDADGMARLRGNGTLF